MVSEDETIAETGRIGGGVQEVMSDMISRQTAISAICNACGKIDCDKMDKCEKLQLPPANSSEIPNNSDTISRQAAIDALFALYEYQRSFDPTEAADLVRQGIFLAEKKIEKLPSAQPEKRTEKRTETHACDLIDREAAVDAIYHHLPSVSRTRARTMLHEVPSAQPEEVTPHRNYQYLSDYWCECGWHLGKMGDVKYCADCGRKVNWDE